MNGLPGGRRRARSAGEKDARRAALLGAGRAALAEHGYDAVTIGAVAAGAGLAKGTAYLYFPTKETLFLALLTEDLGRWFEALPRAIDSAPGADAPARIARAIADTLAGEPVLMQLLALLHGRLEPNTPPDELACFKRFLLAGTTASGAAIAERLGVAPPRGMDLLLRAHALAIGIGQMCAEPPHLAALFEAEPALAVMRLPFAETFAACLEDMMRGWN
jgi:AcrR family transcriptional regulator